MKFWVLAKGESFEEQLLVSADGKEELLRQLQELLHVQVTQMSVTDFQAQVVDKLAQNPSDIIRINLRTAARAAHGTADGVGPFHESTAEVPLSLTSSTKDTSVAPPPQHSSRRGSGASGASEMFAADLPPVEKICLTRETLEQLLYPSLRGEYHAVVQGCFVRVRGATALGSSASGYATVQVVSVVSSSQLALDLVHVVEVRDIDTVSNSPPTADEVKAWARRMIAAGRLLVTPGFVEAKIGDVSVATRASKRLESERSPSAETMPAVPPEASHHSLELDDAPSSILNRLRRRHTTASLLPTEFHESTNTLPSALDPSIRLEMTVSEAPVSEKKSPQGLFGRNLLKVNDSLENGWIVRVQEEDNQQTFVLVGTRHSNARTKHKRPSDFAACALTMGHTLSSVDSNRDITIKGFQVGCAPVLWRGAFWCLGYEVAGLLAFDESQNLSISSSLTIELLGLSGRDLMALYNPPIHVQLPMPSSWGAVVRSFHTKAQLVAFRDALHAFYLVSYIEKGTRFTGLAHAVTEDPRLGSWTLVSTSEPIAKESARNVAEGTEILFHVSVGPNDSLLLLWLVIRDMAAETSANPRSAQAQRYSPRVELSPEPFLTPRLQRSASAGTAATATHPRRPPSSFLGESPGLNEFVFPQSPSPRSMAMSGWLNSDSELRSGAWTPMCPHVDLLGTDQLGAPEVLCSIRAISRIPATSNLNDGKSDVVAFVGEDAKHHALLVLSPLKCGSHH